MEPSATLASLLDRWTWIRETLEERWEEITEPVQPGGSLHGDPREAGEESFRLHRGDLIEQCRAVEGAFELLCRHHGDESEVGADIDELRRIVSAAAADVEAASVLLLSIWRSPFFEFLNCENGLSAKHRRQYACFNSLLDLDMAPGAWLALSVWASVRRAHSDSTLVLEALEDWDSNTSAAALSEVGALGMSNLSHVPAMLRTRVAMIRSGYDDLMTLLAECFKIYGASRLELPIEFDEVESFFGRTLGQVLPGLEAEIDSPNACDSKGVLGSSQLLRLLAASRYMVNLVSLLSGANTAYIDEGLAAYCTELMDQVKADADAVIELDTAPLTFPPLMALHLVCVLHEELQAVVRARQSTAAKDAPGASQPEPDDDERMVG